jgi:hypothetical protein
MARRVVRDDGIRQALIADAERSAARWGIPGRPNERLEVLRSGAAVVVSSAQLQCALMHAGLPHRQFAYGGVDWSKTFMLDENDALREQTQL